MKISKFIRFGRREKSTRKEDALRKKCAMYECMYKYTKLENARLQRELDKVNCVNV